MKMVKPKNTFGIVVRDTLSLNEYVPHRKSNHIQNLRFSFTADNLDGVVFVKLCRDRETRNK